MRRAAAVLAVVAAALALPASAWGHAALVRTVPSAGGTVNEAPTQIALTFTEAVEPRFAAISVTDADARQLIRGRPRRAPGDPNTLLVDVAEPREGWYLVYWRVVSVDGHPVRGAFTFGVGPNPGPAPEFAVPPVSETAATPRLLAARWVALLSAMLAVGLLVMRLLIARSAPGRALSLAWGAAAAVALLAVPVYLVLATAQFSLRSAVDVSALAPLLDASEFGRGYLDLELCLALFALAGTVAIRIDRPGRSRRSIAELAATTGALLAAAAVLLVPGVSGHAGHTSPRGEAVALDWLHLAAGSIWLGGLAGLLVLWRATPRTLAVVVPRFSTVALGAVLVLLTTGTLAAILHLPTLASLWETSYGRALLVKVALLCATLLIAAVNLLRTRPRLVASRTRPELGVPAARLLRRLVLGEAALVAGAVLAAAVLTSLAPPAKAIAALGKPAATVGPGPVSRAVERNGYRLALTVVPNQAAQNNRFAVRLTRAGRPVTGATVTAGFAMLDMEMGQQAYRLTETAPGVYGRAAPALVMVGRWGLSLDVEPPGATPFTVTILDHAGG